MVSKNNKIKRFNIHKIINEKIIKKLRKIIDKKRYIHSLNVAKSAVSLAYKFHINIKKAALAGILHDCAKTLPVSSAKKYLISLKVDDLIVENQAIWHAYTGYLYAKKIFKIKDKEILNAIKYHTVGSETMGKLAKIIYIADFIADGRKFVSLRKIKKLLKNKNISLNQIVILVLKEKLYYLLKKNKKIHIDSIKLYNKIR